MSPPRTYCGVPKKQRTASAAAARLTVLAAAGDTDALWRHAVELLSAPERLGREAALDALLTQPVPAARPALRALYDELDADGQKTAYGAQSAMPAMRISRLVHRQRTSRRSARTSHGRSARMA